MLYKSFFLTIANKYKRLFVKTTKSILTFKCKCQLIFINLKNIYEQLNFNFTYIIICDKLTVKQKKILSI